MPSLTENVYRTLGKHFVTLSCLQKRPGDSEARIFVFSGFVVETQDEWFYVTAGHIIRDIRTSLAQGCSYDRWRFDDQTAGNVFQGKAIPFHFSLDHWLLIEDELSGLDYAAMWLRPMYRLALQAGGVKAIGNDTWGDHLTDHDRWVMLGIPKESVTFDQKVGVKARAVLAPIRPSLAPPGAELRSQNQFYGHLQADTQGTLDDVDGMSGGPVFGLKQVDGQWFYHVIGVQSGWYKASRTIAACPFSSFGAALDDVITEVAVLIKSSSGPAEGAA